MRNVISYMVVVVVFTTFAVAAERDESLSTIHDSALSLASA